MAKARPSECYESTTHSYLVICSTDHHDGYKHLNVKTWTKTFKGFYFVLTSEILGM